MRPSLREEIELRAHDIEGQGDGVFMVLIRMDEIIAAVRAYRRGLKKHANRNRRRDQRKPRRLAR